MRGMSRREWHLACEISIQALATKSFQNQKRGQDRTRFMFLVPRSMQIMVISGTNQSGNAGAEKRPKRELLYAKETSAFKGLFLVSCTLQFLLRHFGLKEQGEGSNLISNEFQWTEKLNLPHE